MKYGTHFEVSDRDLAEQLRKLKLQNSQKEIEIARIKETDPSILELKKKI